MPLASGTARALGTTLVTRPGSRRARIRLLDSLWTCMSHQSVVLWYSAALGSRPFNPLGLRDRRGFFFCHPGTRHNDNPGGGGYVLFVDYGDGAPARSV